MSGSTRSRNWSYFRKLGEEIPTTRRVTDKSKTKVPKKKFYRQVDLFEIFLKQYETIFVRVSSLIRVMLVVATNSSLIKRAFSALKAVKTPLRNRLLLQQLERLLVVGAALPNELGSFDYDQMLEKMS